VKTVTLANDVHSALLQIKKDGPPELFHGICCAVATILERDVDSYEVVTALLPGFEAWPKYTTRPNYPIPGRTGEGEDMSPSAAFIFTPDANMWNPEHPYGALRLELLDFLIEYFGAKL